MFGKPKSNAVEKIPGVGGPVNVGKPAVSGNMTEADGKLGNRPGPGADDGRRGLGSSSGGRLGRFRFPLDGVVGRFW